MGMTQEDIQIRSTYLYVRCSHTVEQAVGRLAGTVTSAHMPSRLLLQQILKRELGLLFRYWITRRVWEQLESAEEDAKRLNLALLRLFTEGFRLARDGSGLRYARLSTPAEEVQELSHRLTNALGIEHQALLIELQEGIASWRAAVTQDTTDALALPLEPLTATVKAWAERASEAGA